MSGQQRRTRMGVRPRLRFATDDRLVSLVRGGEAAAFEVLYDRHAAELLSFCRYMLGSLHDAEDAVQATFVSAHTALLADERAIAVRPWLFAIARNACLSILRRRPRGVEAVEAADPREDPLAQVERREDLRQLLETVLALPERQRSALVLAEVHGLSQAEIGALMGVRAEQVKSYVFQARSSLISERRARGTDCEAIREELATARGAALLKSHLRRHLRSCAGCRDYADNLSRQREQLGALLPVLPSLALKRRALEAALGKSSAGGCAGTATGSSAVGATAELAGGGLKALVVKVLAAVACVGMGTSVGAHLVGVAAERGGHAKAAAISAGAPTLRLAAAVRPSPASARSPGGPRGVALLGAVSAAPVNADRSIRAAGTAPPRSAQSVKSGGIEAAVAAGGKVHGKSEEAHANAEERHPSGKAKGPRAAGNGEAHARGKSEEHAKSEPAANGHAEARGNSEHAHGNGEEAHVKGSSEASHGNSEEAHGKGEEARSAGAAEAVHGKSAESHGKGS